MRFVLKFIFMVASDLYRGLVWLKKVIESDSSLDVAYITNFQNDVERGFLGLMSLFQEKHFAYALRLHLDGLKGRFVGINAVSDDFIGLSENPEKKAKIKRSVLFAIENVSRRGARVVLFGASTKRLFSKEEIADLRANFPNLVFTIGDNGTAIELWQDVAKVIKRKGIERSDKVMIIGPNGFLGSVVNCALKKAGFENLILVSQRSGSPFGDVSGVKLVIACSHHYKLRLTADVIKKITHPDGICVVDVCRPSNFSKKEYRLSIKRGLLVERQDGGNTFNANLKYDIPSISNIALRQLTLSSQRLFGCFSEATALATVAKDDVDTLNSIDFMSVNTPAIWLVEQVFEEVGFIQSPEVNFGKVPIRGFAKVRNNWLGGAMINPYLSAYRLLEEV